MFFSSLVFCALLFIALWMLDIVAHNACLYKTLRLPYLVWDDGRRRGETTPMHVRSLQFTHLMPERWIRISCVVELGRRCRCIAFSINAMAFGNVWLHWMAIVLFGFPFAPKRKTRKQRTKLWLFTLVRSFVALATNQREATRFLWTKYARD